MREQRVSAPRTPVAALGLCGVQQIPNWMSAAAENLAGSPIEWGYAPFLARTGPVGM